MIYSEHVKVENDGFIIFLRNWQVTNMADILHVEKLQ